MAWMPFVCMRGDLAGANKEVYRFICLLGLKILFLPAAILVGSILDGYIAGVLLGGSLSIYRSYPQEA